MFLAPRLVSSGCPTQHGFHDCFCLPHSLALFSCSPEKLSRGDSCLLRGTLLAVLENPDTCQLPSHFKIPWVPVTSVLLCMHKFMPQAVLVVG